MSKWSKKSEEEVKKAVRNKDYTGGYEFGPWLLHMRKAYVLGFLANLGGGIAAMIATWGSLDMLIGGFFAFVAAPLIAFLTRRDYKDGKVGRSR